MLCKKNKKREANVRYSENINGVRRELNLCEECSKKLGIGEIGLDMPINFSSFLSDFFNDYSDNLLPSFMGTQTLQCKNCGTTFDDFVNSGEFGCSNCYNLFEDRITPILRNLQGATRHVGRGYREITPSTGENTPNKKAVKKEESKEEKLQKDLQKAIKDERYEDAAKIRDEIKEIENKENKNTKNNKSANKKDEKENKNED